eukprot:2356509-Amphidinium_carterae.1
MKYCNDCLPASHALEQQRWTVLHLSTSEALSFRPQRTEGFPQDEQTVLSKLDHSPLLSASP